MNNEIKHTPGGAAPDLLEALETLVAAVVISGKRAVVQEAVDKALLLISKAKGGAK
jgi:hypothetical protein